MSKLLWPLLVVNLRIPGCFDEEKHILFKITQLLAYLKTLDEGNSSRPLWFSRNLLRERPKHLHLNNTLPSENYTWSSSRFQHKHKPKVLFVDQSEKKTESGFWTYDPTSKCIMPSFPAFKYREGGYDRRLQLISVLLKGTFTLTKSSLQITRNNFKNQICLKF